MYAYMLWADLISFYSLSQGKSQGWRTHDEMIRNDRNNTAPFPCLPSGPHLSPSSRPHSFQGAS
jgi:hypothetical protein